MGSKCLPKTWIFPYCFLTVKNNVKVVGDLVNPRSSTQ